MTISKMAYQEHIKDVLLAVRLAGQRSSPKLFKAWLLVPLGIMVILVACFGVDTAFKALSVPFPASVACLYLLFLGLLLCEWLLGGHRTRVIVQAIEVPAGWSLRWINVFFTPSFVLLPLSPPISVAEVFGIIAVFLIGFVIMMALAAYITRGLQVLVGSSKRAETQRAEELGPNIQDIPLNESHTPTDDAGQSRATSISQAASTTPLTAAMQDSPQTPPQLRLQDRHYSQTQAPESAVSVADQTTLPTQDPPPPQRAEAWATIIMANIDLAIFATLFLLVGIPVYYSNGYAMPIQLTVTVLTFFAAMALPMPWRTYLHPVLVSSLITVLALWPLAEIRGDSLTTALHEYRTGAKYLELWRQSATSRPGAGDIFATLLDASIVSLALPMFQYRRELRQHYVSIIVPCVAIAVGSLFAYPPVCFAVGISAQRSLAFAARSLTLALATPAVENLGGDVNTVAAIAIISGILGVLIGKKLLDWTRIPQDDYITRGVTLGVNSSAIATALLLRTDPRAAALSSLSMSLFGTVVLLFTSISQIADVIRSFVGL